MSEALRVRTATTVELVDLRRSFGSVAALDGLTMTMAPGELVALLGPSGCGKTTALRALAGLQDLDSGSVKIDGVDITSLPPNRRDMGMVFQAYSLFPHLSALENVGYGLKLKSRRLSSGQRRTRAGELLELVGLGSHASHYPHQLSGGQQQRVALARALAVSPKVLLLDEPLSALDAKVRGQLRDEIRRIQLETGTTTLFVTHDQEEALSVADRVGVMRSGQLEQLAQPAALYDTPATAFVAEFVGLTSPVPGVVENGSIELLDTRVPVLPGSVTSGAAEALLRPEALSVVPDDAGLASVLTVSFLGSSTRVGVDASALGAGSKPLMAQLDRDASAGLTVGQQVRVVVAPSPVFARPVAG